MASDRIIVTKKQTVFIANICSKCGFPVITVASIEARAQKTYTFSRSKAEEIASETAEDAIKAEIRRIESCINTKSPLLSKLDGSSMIVPGHFCESHIDNFETACPLCMNIEPWKSKNNAKVPMPTLKDENFPKVFVDVDEADEWAKTTILKIISDFNVMRENEAYVKEMQSVAVCLDKMIDNWIFERQNLPELQHKEKLQAEKAELEKQNKSVGIFDFKRKKNYLSEIKDLNSRISTISNIINDKQLELSYKIIDKRINSLKARAIGFGCTGKILTKEHENSLVYFLEPSDIPDDILKTVVPETESIKDKFTEHMEIKDDGQCDKDILFCNKCGFELLQGSTFCSKCGNRIN